MNGLRGTGYRALTALMLGVLVSTPAFAQVAKAPGFKVGEGHFHPFLEIDGRFDSLVGRFTPGIDSPEIVLHFRGGAKFDLDTPSTFVNFSGAAEYLWYTGLLTPSWWHEDQTTFGLLKRWSVTAQGSMIDGVALLPITLEQLNLGGSNHIKVRIGIKDDARHQGGINLFGRRFGNYPQDLVMRIAYEFASDATRSQAR